MKMTEAELWHCINKGSGIKTQVDLTVYDALTRTGLIEIVEPLEPEKWEIWTPVIAADWEDIKVKTGNDPECRVGYFLHYNPESDNPFLVSNKEKTSAISFKYCRKPTEDEMELFK